MAIFAPQPLWLLFGCLRLFFFRALDSPTAGEIKTMPSCEVCKDLDKSYASDLDEREHFWHRCTSADLLKSAQKGCGSCGLLLHGIRKFKSDWETFDGKARNRVDFRLYGGGEGIDLSVLFRARAIDEDGSEGDLLSETLLEFYELRGQTTHWGKLGGTRTVPHDCSLTACLQHAPRWIKQCAELHHHSRCRPPNDQTTWCDAIDAFDFVGYFAQHRTDCFQANANDFSTF